MRSVRTRRLRAGGGTLHGRIGTGGSAPLAPLDDQEVWAAGVTYPRSRDARTSESIVADCYDLVYAADHPELFFKGLGRDVRGPGESVGIRCDSTWDVPEPELAVVADAAGSIVAYTVGNDMSSRSIEGEDPLHLPQASSMTTACAAGPCVVGVADAPDLADMTLVLRIARGGGDVVALTAEVASIRRAPAELVEWLTWARNFERGVVLLTGTSIVPEDSFTPEPGDEVTVSIDGLGERTGFEPLGRRGPSARWRTCHDESRGRRCHLVDAGSAS